MVPPSFTAAYLFLKLMPSPYTPPLEVDFASSNLTPLYHYWPRWRHPSSLSHYVNLCPVCMEGYAAAHFIIAMKALSELSQNWVCDFQHSFFHLFLCLREWRDSISWETQLGPVCYIPAMNCSVCVSLFSPMQHRIKRSIWCWCLKPGVVAHAPGPCPLLG